MAPSPLNLSTPIDIDPTSPAINIQTADRFPASPWNEYDTNWKFPPSAPDAPNSNPYTPSYNSFNSWGSASVSWGGRENADPVKMYEDQDIFMDGRQRHDQEDYNPSHYEGDIVGDMEEIPSATAFDGPQLRFTPAFDSSFAQQEHSPAFSGASASSPGSDIDLNASHSRSRASSTSSLHAPTTSPPPEISHSFNSALSFESPAHPSFSVSTHPPSPPPPVQSPGIKPQSPPALLIPSEDGGLAPPQSQHAPGSPSPSTARPGLSAPGVSIHIVPSTPVGGLESQPEQNPGGSTESSYQQLMERNNEAQQAQEQQRYSGAPPLAHAHTEPARVQGRQDQWGQGQPSPPGSGSHASPAQFHSRSDSSPYHAHSRSDSSPFHSHSRSGSSSHASSPAFSPRPQMDFGPRNDFSRVPQTSTGVAFSQHQHRSPAMSSGASSLHGSPLPGMLPDLSPHHRETEFLLPNQDPGLPRPRSASEHSGNVRAWQGGSGLGFSPQHSLSSLSLNAQGTVDPTDVLSPPPDSGESGFNQGQAQGQYARAPHPYDNPHLHPHTAGGGAFAQPAGGDTYLAPASVSVRRVKSDGHRRGVKSEDLSVPPSQHLDYFMRGTGGAGSNLLAPPGLGLLNVSGGPKHHRRGHDRHSSLGSHGHASVRSSPYPSPNASPARASHGLPDVGGGGGGVNVFDTYGAGAAGPDSASLNTTNPPRKLVTTKATHDASSARRKNDPGFVCPVPGCGSTFTRSFNLKGHLRSHNEERPFKCKWPGCEKGFARQHDCKRHEALHLNIRPYTCAGCKKTFARMDALNRHLRSEGGADCAAHEQPLQGVDDHQRGNPNGDLGPADTGLIM